MDPNEEDNPAFSEFAFLGDQGDIAITKEANHAVACSAGRAGYVPAQILNLPGKKSIITVTPNSRLLDIEFYYFQVQSTKHMQNRALLAPLPLTSKSLTEDVGQSSSYTPPPHELLGSGSHAATSSVDQIQHKDAPANPNKNKIISSHRIMLLGDRHKKWQQKVNHQLESNQSGGYSKTGYGRLTLAALYFQGTTRR